MGTVIKINGTNRTSVTHRNDLSVTWRNGGRASASARLFDVASGSWRPEVGQEFIVEVNATDVMGGSIDQVETKWPGSTVLDYDLLIVGWEMLLDKQRINAVAFGKNFFTTNSISDTLTFDSGFVPGENGYAMRVRSAGTLPAGLSASTTYFVINKDVAGAGKCQLSLTSGGAAVNFTDDGSGDHWMAWMAGSVVTNIALVYGTPEGITLGTISPGSPVEGSSFEWASALEIIDAMAALSGYVSHVTAAKALNFVPRTAFTAPFSITATTSEVLFKGLALRETREEKGNRVFLRISMDAYADTTANFVGDGTKRKFRVATVIQSMIEISVDAVAQTVGTYGETDSQWYYTPGDHWVVQDPDGPAVGSGIDIFVTYRAFGFDAQMAEDTADQTAVAAQEPGTSGIYDQVLQEPGVTSQAAGDAVVASLLARYKTLPREFTYSTREPGLLPGQLQNINLPLFGISTADYLVNEVSAALDADAEFRYTVKAISTTRLGNYLSMFEAMLSGGGGGGTAVGDSGGGGAVIEQPGDFVPL